jgi:zinc protease
MKKINLLLIQICFLITFVSGENSNKWAHNTSDLKPDPSVTFGVLKNGIRYAIMPNSEPPKRISMRLFVDAGSLMESKEQQGLAHFIEHMAFNGTKNFPAGEMVEYFQRLGMSFGGDTNAHTSFKETVYKLELPKPEKEMIERAMLLFRDYADGMLMSKEEIEKERGVILSELITRDSAEWRTQKEAYKFALPDSLISKRFPIGTKKVIKGAGRSQFMNFYTKWYTPDRMAIVVVGDVVPKTVIPIIEKHFSAMESPKVSNADPNLGKITVGRGIITKTHYEKEASETNVSIEVVNPYSWEPDDTNKNIKSLKLLIANSIINNRISEITKKKGTVITGGGSYAQDFLDFAKFASIYVTCEPENWEGALSVAEQEIRRVLNYGFNESEFNEVKANFLNAYEQANRSSSSRKSRSLADSLTRSISMKKVFSSPQQDLNWITKNISSLDKESCYEEVKDAWNSEDRQIFIGGNIELTKADNKIIEVYKKSVLTKIEALKDEGQSEFAYKTFGAPGKVVERVKDNSIGVTQIRFDNNVRLNIKKTDYSKDSITIGARIGAGMLSMPKDKPGLDVVASAVFDAGGLNKHSSDELRRIFAGKTVSGSFSVGDDAFVYSGATNQKDFADTMQLMTAYLTDPGYREEAFRQFKNKIDPIYTQLSHTPMGVLQDQVDRFLKSNDYRAGFPVRSDLEKITVNDVQSWLEPSLKKGYLEVGVVGDLDEEEIIKIASKTIGSLPERNKTKGKFKENRIVEFPKTGQSKEFIFESEIPKAMIGVYWPTEDIWNISRTRRLSVLGTVFADRLRSKVREELGEAYSPYARHIPSDTYDGYGYLMSILTVDPEQAEKIVEVVRSIGSDLSKYGITEDELQRALKPLLNSIDQQLRQNSYWLRTVALSSQEFPEKLEWAKTMVDDYKRITLKEVNNLASKYLKNEKSVSIKVIPKQ